MIQSMEVPSKKKKSFTQLKKIKITRNENTRITNMRIITTTTKPKAKKKINNIKTQQKKTYVHKFKIR